MWSQAPQERRFSSLGNAPPPLKVISSGIASQALHEKGRDLIHSIWQKGIITTETLDKLAIALSVDVSELLESISDEPQT